MTTRTPAVLKTQIPEIGLYENSIFAEKGPLPLPHPQKSAIWSIVVIEGVTQLREPSGVSRLSPWGELSTGAEGRVSRSVWSNNNNQRILELERVGSKVKTFLASNFQSLMRPKATIVWPCKSMADQQDQKSVRIRFWPFQYCSAVVNIIKENISFHEFAMSNW